MENKEKNNLIEMDKSSAYFLKLAFKRRFEPKDSFVYPKISLTSKR